MTDQEVVRYRAPLVALAVVVGIWGVLGLVDRPNDPFSGLHFGSGNEVTFVSEESPADQAGVVAGDRLLSLGGVAVEGRRDIEAIPRPEIGETEDFVIERDGERLALEMTYVGQPLTPLFFSIIGFSFLGFGLWAYLVVPTRSTLYLACAGVGLGTTISSGAYLPAYALRAVADSLDFIFPTVGFAFLLLFLVTYPRPKFESRRKLVTVLIFAPAVLLGLADLVLAVVRAPGLAEWESLVRLFGGILVLLFLVSAVAAALHSFFAASKDERRALGLNVALAGVAAGFLPLLLTDLVFLVLGIEASRVMDVAVMMIAVVPMSLALAAVRSERAEAG